MLLVILVVVLTAGMIGTSLVAINQNAIKDVSKELYQAVALNVNDRLHQKIDNITILLQQASATLSNPQISGESAVSIVSTALSTTDATEAIGIYSTEGVLIDVLSKGRQTSLPQQLPEALRQSLTHSEVIIGTPQRFINEGGAFTLPVIPVIARWSSNKKPNDKTQIGQGILMALVDNEHLCAIAADVSVRAFSGARQHVWLTDDSLRLIAHSEQYRLFSEGSLQRKEIFRTAGMQGGKLPAELVGVAIEYTKNAAEGMPETAWVGAFVPVASLKLVIVVEQTRAVAYKSVSTMRDRVIMWSLVSIIAGIALSILIARQFAKPIKQLVHASEQLAAQNFSVRLPEQGTDEFGMLFAVQNRVAEELGRYQALNINRVISERNKLEAIVRQASDGIFIVDSTWRVLMFNQVFSAWFDVHGDEEGQPLNSVLERYSTTRILTDHFMAIAILPDHLIPVEARVQQVGEIRETVLRGSLVKVLVEGKIAALMMILRDVTKEVEVDRMKTELVSVVAHELRSPLNSIIGMSELIGEGELQQKENMDFASRITAQAEQLNGIITKFLDLNRIESGKTELHSVPIKMDDVLKSMLKVNMRLAEKKGMTVSVHVPNKMSPVLGDPDLIGQAMLNLFGNAVKYSGAGTSVFIEIIEKADKILFSVQDQGYGISESSKSKLFTKFFRATEDERVRTNTGTGLGLAFVKEIIERHGGEVGVESQLNVGSTFWFSLPK